MYLLDTVSLGSIELFFEEGRALPWAAKGMERRFHGHRAITAAVTMLR
jgi:hypothetical protein